MIKITTQEIQTEPVRADKEIVEKFRILVKRKYGKLKGVMGEEMTIALDNHCHVLEQELAES